LAALGYNLDRNAGGQLSCGGILAVDIQYSIAQLPGRRCRGVDDPAGLGIIKKD